MLRTMTTATNTLNQIQTQIDTISNNIANSNTAGYKAKEARFSELLYQQFNNDKLDPTIRQSPVGIRYGVGAKIGQIQTNNKAGGMQKTDRALDFAFTKDNQYFNVLMPDGENGTNTVYTRQGNFYITPVDDEQVMLVNGDGYPIADVDGNAIYFPEHAQSFTTGDGGLLTIQYADGNILNVELGVTTVQKPQVMQPVGAGSYIDLPENFDELGYTEEEIITNMQGVNRIEIGLSNGQLEMSNVDLSKEMTDLIQAQRSYQFNARAVTIADQMLGLINGIR